MRTGDAPPFHFVLPGAPETPTGGFIYDRHMIAALRRMGRLAGVHVLPGAFPRPSPSARAAADRIIAAIPGGATVVVDGLALTPLAASFAENAGRFSVIALVHHPLGDETGLSPAECSRLRAEETRALALARGVLVTSAHTAERLAAFDIPPERIRVARPGTAQAHGGWRRIKNGGELRLLCVATLTPRKGQDVLLRALACVRHLDWRLTLAGPARDPAFARRLRLLARALGLADRITFAGQVPAARLAGLYRAADLSVFPSHYEGFGMAAADAAAHGLPIVATDAGALAEALGTTSRRLAPPGDPPALARALLPLLTGKTTSLPQSQRRPRLWAEAGREFVAALDALAQR